MKQALLSICAAALGLAMAGQASAASTLETVKARGKLICGVNTGLLGFSARTEAGVWSGLDVTAKYGVIYRNGGNNDILGFFDIDDALPAGRVIAGTDFIINWTAGIFALTRVD